uniref:MARVEL domain-containing protein n=1 Tax=Panagrellus redivivus TaxID=6233 RepID=A0A7E4V8Z4_PANRE
MDGQMHFDGKKNTAKCGKSVKSHHCYHRRPSDVYEMKMGPRRFRLAIACAQARAKKLPTTRSYSNQQKQRKPLGTIVGPKANDENVEKWMVTVTLTPIPIPPESPPFAMFGIREPLLPARNPLSVDSNPDANLWFGRFGVFFTSIGILISCIYLVHKAYLFLFDYSKFKADFPVLIAAFLILFVCCFAAYAQKSRNRAGYYPAIAFLWFVKYGSVATLANNLASMMVRNVSNISVDNDANLLNIWLIVSSFIGMVVSSFLHYVYWANYKLNNSRSFVVPANRSSTNANTRFRPDVVFDEECFDEFM